ncbi:hypothetical protein [Crenothrix sp.]|uniref:hypothetical protein n=1 Tax=Crenothrix sp. TaxID=3100433 RepID=UPI00374D39C8
MDLSFKLIILLIYSYARYILDTDVKQPEKEINMWILFFIVAILFVLGNGLLLLRSANTSKLPENVKSQPYDKDESSGW